MLIKPPAKYAQGFWTKAVEWKGIYVLGNSQVPDEAVYRAAEIVFNSIAMVNPKIVAALAKHGARFVVIPEEVTDITKLPDYSDLPSVPWGAYRGLGGIIGKPTSSSGEENLLNLPSDPYNGSESIGLHEWLHAVEGIGLATAFPSLHTSFKAAYQNALAKSLWQNTYADDTFYEYFAETGQAYFSNNPNINPTNGIHNDINTRLELMGYDPTAYNLHVRIFGATPWKVGSFFGTAAANSLNGTRGDDAMFGNGGNDRLNGKVGNDKLVGGPGNDFLFGDVGNDVLEGDQGNDNLQGRAGNDTMNGGPGNDILIGYTGQDTMTGSTGNDIFVFTSRSHSPSTSARDIITDFDDPGRGNDRINISSLFGPKMQYIHAAEFTKAGQVRIEDVRGPDVIVEVNTGGSLAPDFSIRLKGTTLASMTAGDFIL